MTTADFRFPNPLWWAFFVIVGSGAWALYSLTTERAAFTAGDLLIVGILLIIVHQLRRK